MRSDSKSNLRDDVRDVYSRADRKCSSEIFLTVWVRTSAIQVFVFAHDSLTRDASPAIYAWLVDAAIFCDLRRKNRPITACENSFAIIVQGEAKSLVALIRRAGNWLSFSNAAWLIRQPLGSS